MITRIISIGDKVEVLRPEGVSGAKAAGAQQMASIMVSQVLDIPDEHTILMAMPMEKTHTIPLRVGDVYDMSFLTQNGTYTSRGKVTSRYMENSQGILVIELVSTLEKVQRRQFFRVECIADIQLHVLSSEELNQLETFEQQDNKQMDETEQLLMDIHDRPEEWEQGIITDISGGGARFTTRNPLPEGATLFLNIELEQKEEMWEHHLFAHLISSREVAKRPGFYENRVQFIRLKRTEREEIIRFVFDEDRKRLKRERGN